MTADRSAIDTLLEAAILAPSGDNTQPWRFEVDRENQLIQIEVDPTRDPSPMNARQRMAWIAIGAAIENMARTARQNGWSYRIDPLANETACFRLESGAGAGTIDPLLVHRVTNRRLYRSTHIDGQMLERLSNLVEDLDGTTATWLVDREQIQRLTAMIARADALILSTKPVRDAFLAKVRFDQPVEATVQEGLSLGSLEVSGMERFLLKQMKRVPDGLLRSLGGRKVFAGVAKKLAGSASGICLIGTQHDGLQGCVDVGRVWQRAWLGLTQMEFAAQPMMSLCVLQTMYTHGDPDVIERLGRPAARKLLEEFEAWFREVAPGKPASIMRFGTAEEPTTRTGRLPVASKVASAGSSAPSHN